MARTKTINPKDKDCQINKAQGNNVYFYAVMALLSVATAKAGEPTQTFHIPPQSLAGALNEYAAAADVQLSYPAQETAGLNTIGLDGDYTQTQALQKLLSGTGLSPQLTANGTITLARQGGLINVADNGQNPQSAGETSLPKVMVEADGIVGYDPDYDHDPY